MKEERLQLRWNPMSILLHRWPDDEEERVQCGLVR